MSTETVNIEVREDGSRVVQRSLEDIARQAEVTQASINLMKSALMSIQGSIKGPNASLQQMRSSVNALLAASRSPGGILDPNNIEFTTAALKRLQTATAELAANGPNKIQAAVGRVNMGIAALGKQVVNATQPAGAAAQSLTSAVNAAAAAMGGGGGGKAGGGGGGGGGGLPGAAGRGVFSLRNLSSAFWDLQNIIRLTTVYLGLRELKDYVDTWIGIENSIRLSTKTSAEATAVQESLFNVAQKTRAPMEEMVKLYRRLAQSQQKLGASQQDMIDLTEGVGMALVIQGSDTTQAKGALLQLGQSFGMARVRAQEFNSINENAPRILQAIADNVDGAGGSIDTLRQLVTKGSVSGKVFFDAFMKGLPKLREEFDKARPSISQAFTVLDNAIGKYIHDTDESIGASTLFAQAVIGLAANLDILATSLLAVGVGALVLGWTSVTGVLVKAANAVKALWATLVANPVTAILALIAAVVVALVTYRDQIILVQQDSISLGDYMRAAWEFVSDAVKGVIQDFKMFVTMPGAIGESFSGLGTIFSNVIQMVKNLINAAVGSLVFLAKVGPVVLSGLPGAIGDFFVQGMNLAIGAVERGINWLSTKINNWMKEIEAPGWVDIPMVDFEEITNNSKGAAGEFADEMRALYNQAFSPDYLGDLTTAAGNKVQAFFDNWTERARKFALERQKHKGAGADLTVKPPPPEPVVDQSYLKNLRKDLEQLYKTVDPTVAAIHALVEANTTLNQAVSAGLINEAERDRLRERVIAHYRDLIDPLGAVVRNLEEEIKWMGMDSMSRSVGIELMKTEKQLRKDGIWLTDDQRRALGDLIHAKEQAKLVSQEEERAYNKLVAPQKNLIYGQLALNKLLDAGAISMTSYHREMSELTMNAGQGTWTTGFLLQLDAMDERLRNWHGEIGGMFAQLTNDITKGFADAAASAMVLGEDFEESLGNAARQAVAGLISSLIQLGIQMMLNNVLEHTLRRTQTGMTLASIATTTAAAEAAMGTLTLSAGLMGASIASAMAPAAALTSLATSGGNAVAAQAALTTTMSMAELMALPRFGPGFESGGFTGYMGRKTPAGIVHGQEFVVNANATAANREVLEAMNRGARFSGASAIGIQTPVEMNIVVENNSTAHIAVERVSPTDVRIIAREEGEAAVRKYAPAVVAADLRNPNGRTSKAVTSSTTARRQR